MSSVSASILSASGQPSQSFSDPTMTNSDGPFLFQLACNYLKVLYKLVKSLLHISMGGQPPKPPATAVEAVLRNHVEVSYMRYLITYDIGIRSVVGSIIS